MMMKTIVRFFLPRDAVRKRGLFRYAVSVRPFVCHVRLFN